MDTYVGSLRDFARGEFSFSARAEQGGNNELFFQAIIKLAVVYGVFLITYPPPVINRQRRTSQRLLSLCLDRAAGAPRPRKTLRRYVLASSACPLGAFKVS